MLTIKGYMGGVQALNFPEFHFTVYYMLSGIFAEVPPP